MAAVPAIDPWQRIVAVRAYEHGLSVRGQGDTPGAGLVRPFKAGGSPWTHRATDPAAGNIVWTGSTPRHTVAYNGPRGRYFGTLTAGTFAAMKTWFAHNGTAVPGPGGRVLGACVKTYTGLPTSQTYAGTGTGTLTLASPATGATVTTGDWRVRCIVPGAAALFDVLDPAGVSRGVASLAALFDGPLRFTITAGAAAFAVGDEWTIAAEEAQQFVAIVTPSINATPQTETVWRRGVSLTPESPWRQIASIAPVTGQVDGSIQPWFFNASATQAVTCRGLGDDAAGYTNGVVGRSLNLDTLAVTDTVETSAPATYTKTYSVTAADGTGAHALTDVAVSNSTGAARQLMATDFDGDQLVRVEVEFDGLMDGTSSMYEIAGQTGFEDGQGDADVSATYSAWADIIWTGSAEYRRLRVFGLSASASLAQHWPPATSPGVFTKELTETFTVRVLRDILDARATQIAYTEYSGSRILTDTGDGSGAFRSGSGIEMRHWVGGVTVAEVMGGVGAESVSLTGFVYAHLIYLPGSPEDSFTSPAIVQVDTISAMGVGALGSVWKFTQALAQGGNGTIATGGLPAVNTSLGKGFQAGATDTRGNWLLAAEIAAPDLSLWPGSFPASGTYTLQTGGPDGLTPATVADLSGHAGADVWDVGAF